LFAEDQFVREPDCYLFFPANSYPIELPNRYLIPSRLYCSTDYSWLNSFNCYLIDCRLLFTIQIYLPNSILIFNRSQYENYLKVTTNYDIKSFFIRNKYISDKCIIGHFSIVEFLSWEFYFDSEIRFRWNFWILQTSFKTNFLWIGTINNRLLKKISCRDDVTNIYSSSFQSSIGWSVRRFI